MRALFLILLVSLVALVPGEASRRRLLLEKANEREQSAGGGGGAVDNTLIVRYKFDEGSGTAVNDSTANNNDATLTGGVTWITGKSGSGGAVRFDGSNDTLGSDAGITFGTSIITVSAWVKATWPGGGTTAYLWSLGSGAAANTHWFRSMTDFSTFQNYSYSDAFTGGKRRDDTPDPTDATWVHIAVVYDNSTANGAISVYYDGVLQSPDNDTTAKTGTGNFNSGYNFYIASLGGASAFFACDVDDLRIYSGELTVTEIEYVRDNPDE